MMNFGDALHRALDYFFCDRCPTEVIDSRLSDKLGNVCPIDQVMWKHIAPLEAYDMHHPIRFPRSWMGKVLPDRGLQSMGPEKYPTSSQEFMSWKDFDKACKQIAKWATQYHFQDVYGIPRGGLVVAVRISHLLGIPVQTQTYLVDRFTLVVDDICDTGKSLARFYNRKTATLYYKRNNVAKPDYWVKEKKQRWIVFPWEER